MTTADIMPAQAGMEETRDELQRQLSLWRNHL
jgi:hypothetical protein